MVRMEYLDDGDSSSTMMTGPALDPLLRALVDASNDALLLLDSQGRAILINRRAKYFFGLAERDVIGRSAAQLRAMFQLIFEDSATFHAWLAPLLTSIDERAVLELKVLRAEPR